MKTKFTNKYFLILIATVTFSFNLFSNDFQGSNDKLGVGFSTEHSFFTENGAGILFPPNHILLSSNKESLKIDLGLMFFSENMSDDNSEASRTTIDFFLGVYFKSNLTKSLDLYYGAKLGVIASMTSYEYGPESDSENSIEYYYLTPSLGVEYFFIPSFSISAEIGIRMNILDDEDNDFDKSQTYINTTSSLLIKWYF